MIARLLAVMPWFLALAASAQVPVRYARNPALSPDGSQVAFEWCGDIFIAPVDGGAARAVTANQAPDSYPRFTPDGQHLVFASTRSGNWDVYRVGIGGGEPKRLTFHGGTDVPWCVMPDGSGVVFQSGRYARYGQRFGPPMLVSLNGGTPTRFAQFSAGDVAISPDGGKVAFVHKRSDWYWRGYKGGAAEDLWLWDKGTGAITKLTDYAGPDLRPLFSADGSAIFFLSDRVGRHNLWRMPTAGGEAQQVTRHEQPIREAMISGSGNRIAYACDDDLYVVDTAGGEPRKLAITGPLDRLDPEVLYAGETRGIGEYAVSPSGREVAFVVRGDIYCCRYPDGGPTTQLTDTPQDEGGLAWSEDSKTLYFHSDRHDQYDLFSLTSADEAEPRLRRSKNLRLTRLTETPEDETNLLFSPDRKRVAYFKGYGDIVVAKADLTEPTVILDSDSNWDLTWSPDSRWLAYTHNDEWSNSDVWIISADGGEPANISQHPDGDGNPVFSGDMKRLAFVSSRFDDQTDVFYVYLNRADWLMPQAERDFVEDDAYDKPKPEEPAPAEGQEPKPEETKPEEKPEPPPAVVDLEDVDKRLVRVTYTGDQNERGLLASPDGKKLAWIDGGGTLVATDWVTISPAPIVGGGPGALEWTKDGRQIRYLAGGRLNTIPAGGGPAKETSHTARIERVVAEERAYVLDKCWQAQRDYFYDDRMHGCDWPAAREFYRPKALAAPTREAFADVMNRMIGELGASHQGYSAPGRGVEASTPPAADLGIVWTEDRGGPGGPGYVVDRIERDGPAERAPDGPRPGEKVISIDGVELVPSVNVYELLLGKSGQRIALVIEAADGTRRTAWLRGVSAGQISGARYENWQHEMRALVKERSGGKFGYLHVPGMSPGGVEQFQRDLQAAAGGKQGIIVDVRWNGGGGSFDMILSSLVYRPYVYNTQRGRPANGFPTGWLPVPVFRGPSAALWNEGSGSGAEIFGHAWRYLKVGPSAGWPSWGGVIGTGGITLIDGSSMRLPLVGYFNLDGTNQEGNPAQPERIIDITPNDEVAGRDPQIEAAVTDLLAVVAQ